MFRPELSKKFSEIFGLRKTTFDAPSGNTYEQDTLFVEIIQCHSRATDGRIYSRVSGTLIVFAQMDKMPFGFFSKKIQQAEASAKKDILFFDIDLNPASSPARIQNITERRVSFVYLYSAQYNPAHGQITSLEGI